MEKYFGNSSDVTRSIDKPYYGAYDPSTYDYYGAFKSPDKDLYGSLTSPNYQRFMQLQQQAADGVSVASQRDWTQAWKSQQIDLMKKNVSRENHEDPTPLLIDVISSLPADSQRRRSAENFKSTFDGTASNVGEGLDALTRESYKEARRLSKRSNMIQYELNSSLPTLSQIIGFEENTSASNLQSWKPMFINASIQISDAVGSHADTEHAINRDAAGSVSLIPLATTAHIDHITPHLINEAEGVFKSLQYHIMQHLPSKLVGSIRQLATALDSVLSIPFEIMSDVYSGLMKLIDEVSNLLDIVITKITEFITGILGGLMDNLFPGDLLDSILEPILEIASEFGDLFSLLNGFPAISNITSALSSILGGNILGGIASLASLINSGAFGATSRSRIVCGEEQLGLTKLGKIGATLNNVLGTASAIGGILGILPGLGAGLGNLGAIIGGTVSNFITGNVRNFANLLSNLLPTSIGYILNKFLSKLCSMGMVGNNGYSIGETFAFTKETSFSKALKKFAAHLYIVGPLFGKKTVIKGSYSREGYFSTFNNSRFVVGAQGNKGVTMIGPGATLFQKPFGSSQRGFSPYSSGVFARTNNFSRTSYKADPLKTFVNQAKQLLNPQIAIGISLDGYVPPTF